MAMLSAPTILGLEQATLINNSGSPQHNSKSPRRTFSHGSIAFACRPPALGWDVPNDCRLGLELSRAVPARIYGNAWYSVTPYSDLSGT
jgi:hypothetical protein